MKTQIISRISGCFLSILLVSSSFAQADFATRPQVVITGADVKVNEKILTEFSRFFANAENVRWYDDVYKKFVVKFFMDDQNHQVLLTKKGNLVYHISYGSEKHLPAEVRKMIKSEYYDYRITLAIKVEEDNRTIWVVNMEDDKSLIIARVEDGVMEEVRNLRKSL